ncbi:asparagine--tRNA ligase [Mycoplasma putrefaciens]|uniref:Asparagine--tRNA ligase n=1 Tax=Mycoplasma putrefaciens (strain ATCC 15718 / NCTC 10155 / C30 KS-1 / KS-1) TaxID=743965 RepID=A0A7U4E9I8_MYCPK|nr:asparagine--tRNA ligase [Mycoplasma putrefaciens]AEM68974.1 asparaginyl-tRNA synthetase [Mycoplasma putrefaciens KS1]
MEIKQLIDQQNQLADTQVSVIARIRSNRQGKAVSFMVLTDGTTLSDIQVVYKTETKGFADAQQARVSSIVEVKGKLVLTPDKPQPFEIQATEIELLDQAIEDYPLQKKEHSAEFLREIAHLRAKTKTFNSIFRIRSTAAYAIHKFFQDKNFVYVHSPIITGNDAEGAGEAFLVTTRQDGDYAQDFFAKRASLTVSGQLHAEAFAQAFKNVYTFGPTFRAENSNTAKHAAEFWMIEPEVAFADLQDNINLIQEMVKYVINYIFEKNYQELEFCDQNLEKGLIDKLNSVRNSEFKITTYTQAIEILKQAVKNGHKFEVSEIEFGLDLGTEHERYICEQVNKAPTFVTNYPKEIKAFYMKQNPDQKTVAAVDLLVPGIGELVGGSQREDDYQKLISRCKEMKIDVDQLDWYNNLRQYGYYKSAGFGLGFERLIMYVTGASNIRDVIAFPRTPKNLLF